MAKKKKKPAAKKKVRQSRPRRTEVTIRVQAQTLPAVVPTTTDLAEPITGKGQKLTIPSTWLSSAQLIRLTEKTPPQQIYKRPGKGGKIFDYVTVSYVQRVLDYVTGWNWDFDIVEHGKEADHVWVLGKLTIRSADGKHQITKQQFGRSEIKYITEKRGNEKVKTTQHVDYGNDLKAAASDALKKCASMLGIARDIYGKGDYKEETGKDPRDNGGGNQQAPQTPPPAEKPADGPVKELYCHGATKSGCPMGNEITEQGYNYSMQVYGRPLCRECAKLATPLKKK